VVRRVIGQGVDLKASWALCVRDTSAVMVVVVSWLGWVGCALPRACSAQRQSSGTAAMPGTMALFA
jgi:hypothetical protein